ncbi:MAG: hypothetical protein ABI977_25210 [Acidobacteriota bacterium]
MFPRPQGLGFEPATHSRYDTFEPERAFDPVKHASDFGGSGLLPIPGPIKTHLRQMWAVVLEQEQPGLDHLFQVAFGNGVGSGLPEQPPSHSSDSYSKLTIRFRKIAQDRLNSFRYPAQSSNNHFINQSKVVIYDAWCRQETIDIIGNRLYSKNAEL